MSSQILLYIMGITGGLFTIILVLFLVLKKKQDSTNAQLRKLQSTTKENKFNSEIMYQKLYIIFSKIPVIKRYLLKMRRKLEIIHIDDEYKTRRDSAYVLFKALIIVIPLAIAILFLTHENTLLMVILLFFEVFLFETIMTGAVDKLDTKILKQQVDFFAEIRHAYHEFNMVEEAIYEVSQNDELEVSRQGQKIYEILISDDPETELEKYYDVAPNSFLKEFAGISHLTREFGDRTIDGASLYLKNLNNITEEMQLEILKREKLDYVFQSLSFISVAPVLFLQPLRNWAVSNFSFTSQFYDGKMGLIFQIAILIITFICYVLVRKVKDTGSIKDEYKDPNNTWQMKLYRKKYIKKIVDLFIPKKNTKEYRQNTKLMKDAAVKKKMEDIYVTRIALFFGVFIISLAFFFLVHKVAINFIYTEPVANFDLLGGELSEREYATGMETREIYNKIIEKVKGNYKITKDQLRKIVAEDKYFKGKTDEEIDKATEDIFSDLQIVQNESFKWFELLLAFVFAYLGYNAPIWILIFQKILRNLEMENEIMEFQTIITMLMKIERVNVEMILEWLERYSNIFREPITKCLNNYEAGAWEALEEFKNDITFPQLIRLIESMQSAVEKIPISQAFDELDNEREYYKAKREESNNRLISRKGRIGKIIGFTPMVALFVGYLIGPLVVIGLTAMTESFSSMSTSM